MAYAALALLLAGCALGSNQRLVIDTSEVPAVRNLTAEVRIMLEGLGYEMIPESDNARFANTFTNYTMHFKARDADNIRVDVQFQLVDNLTRIHLYNTEEKTPGTATLRRYDTLRKQAKSVFGADSVK